MLLSGGNSMSEQQLSVNSTVLEEYVNALFAAVGLQEDDAKFMGKALVETNLMGIDSHGVLRVPAYLSRLRIKAMNPKPIMRSIREAGALRIIDGDNGPGFLVGRNGMQQAIGLAKEFSVGIVGAINSNHFGAASLYANMAVLEGMAGIAMTNVGPNMVAAGASKPVVGNNPIAIAFPTFGDYPFSLDISLSAVAGGKLLLASKKKEKIPLDWATDKEGRPTDDPDKAFAGFLLPMGGHKGLGLAYAVDILCGVLTGGCFLDQLKGMYKYPKEGSLTCHLFLAINTLKVLKEEDIKERMGNFSKTIKSTPTWDESAKMLIPGEIEHQITAERKRMGIPLPTALFEELVQWGEELRIDKSLVAIKS
jgi:LDH2 family malate/lactate/ureidoglycolate dehydrogenase